MCRHGLIPPAGVPFPIRLLISALPLAVMNSPEKLLMELGNKFGEMLGLHLAFVSDSATTCLVQLLELVKDGTRTQVVVPSYTCPTVYDAVQEAGLEVVICSVDYHDFSLKEDDLARLIGTKTLAVVDQHLFGFAVNLERKRRLLDAKKIILIEDCAQAMSPQAGVRVGGVGHYAMFSFGLDKVITSSGGGAVLAHDASLATGLRLRTSSKISNSPVRAFTDFAVLLLYRLALSPFLWRFLDHLRHTIVSRKRHQASERMLSKMQIAFLIASLDWLPSVRKLRSDNLLGLLAQLKTTPYFCRIPKNVGDNTVYADALRLPIIFDDSQEATEVAVRLHNQGISTTRMFEDSADEKVVLCLPTCCKYEVDLG